MSKDNPIKNHQYKSGESVNLNGRSKGSLGGKKVVKAVSYTHLRAHET